MVHDTHMTSCDIFHLCDHKTYCKFRYRNCQTARCINYLNTSLCCIFKVNIFYSAAHDTSGFQIIRCINCSRRECTHCSHHNLSTLHCLYKFLIQWQCIRSFCFQFQEVFRKLFHAVGTLILDYYGFISKLRRQCPETVNTVIVLCIYIINYY